MASVYLAMGSNVGNSKKHIERAQKLLLSKMHCVVSAPLYKSKAVGYTDQADFLNTVVSGQTELEPEDLLAFVKDVEAKIGRTKTFRWGPREMDIDIIFYDDMVMDQPDLTIPHPRFAAREFVLKPLSDLDPGLIDPKSELPVSVLLTKLAHADRSIL